MHRNATNRLTLDTLPHANEFNEHFKYICKRNLKSFALPRRALENSVTELLNFLTVCSTSTTTPGSEGTRYVSRKLHQALERSPVRKGKQGCTFKWQLQGNSDKYLHVFLTIVSVLLCERRAISVCHLWEKRHAAICAWVSLTFTTAAYGEIFGIFDWKL